MFTGICEIAMWVTFPHVSAKRKEKEYGYESDAGVRTSAHRLFW